MPSYPSSSEEVEEKLKKLPLLRTYERMIYEAIEGIRKCKAQIKTYLHTIKWCKREIEEDLRELQEKGGEENESGGQEGNRE